MMDLYREYQQQDPPTPEEIEESLRTGPYQVEECEPGIGVGNTPEEAIRAYLAYEGAYDDSLAPDEWDGVGIVVVALWSTVEDLEGWTRIDRYRATKEFEVYARVAFDIKPA